MTNYEQYAAFLREYDALLKDILATQQQMLAAITANRLEDIRACMNAAQAGNMRLEKLETRRLALQQEGGLGDLGIHQVVEQLPAEESAPLLPLCDSIDATAREIRFVGEKSMGMAQCNLADLDPSLLEEVLPHPEEGAKENPYGKQRRAAADKPSMETKA